MKMLMEKGAESLAGLVRWIRGERVMLDADLARLYGVTTRALNKRCAGIQGGFHPPLSYILPMRILQT